MITLINDNTKFTSLEKQQEYVVDIDNKLEELENNYDISIQMIYHLADSEGEDCIDIYFSSNDEDNQYEFHLNTVNFDKVLISEFDIECILNDLDEIEEMLKLEE